MKWQRSFHLGLVAGFCLLLSSCAYMGGGADYLYEWQGPNGQGVKMQVHSNRKIQEGVEFEMDPATGKVRVKTGSLQPGASSLHDTVELIKLLRNP